MHEKNRKRYSREFKQEALKRTQAGKTVAEVARELEMPVYQLYRWRNELDQNDEEAFHGKRHVAPNSELEMLRRENRRLKEERDILKKSLVFFAREGSNDSGS